ncbi:MAG TPA: CsgG/HfaB family protein [Candidatus Cloacimonadota bacterium]|nr:CsgG/HfaB family protein [Candidatus Cloacimonadota bacterium]
MKLVRFSILLVVIIFAGLGAGCSQNKQISRKAENYFKQGDYHNASLMAVESLKLKASNPKAQQTLLSAYPLALQEQIEEIDRLKSANDSQNWPRILKAYQSLQTLNEAIRSLPPVTDPNSGERIRFDYRDYSSEISDARNESADYFYRQGVHHSMLSSEASTQKKAAGFFKEAMVYITDYKDSALRYEEARQKAIRRIAILPFEDKSGSRGRYGAISDMLADQIISGILKDKASTEFVELITRDQIDRVIEEQQLSSSGLVDEASAARIGVLVGAHEILSGRILQIDYSSPKTVSVELQEKSNITVEREDGEDDEELEVECIYSKLTKRSSLQIVASYSVIDVASGRIDTQQSFTASETFEKDWGRFISGDRRALSPQQKALISTAEPIAPTDKDMINSALTELSQGIVNHFCHYLK